jgi:hypothetical protein
MSAQHTPGPQASRIDIDFWPAWMDENPALFVQRVREFLDQHPEDKWECRIGKFAYLVRLTAIAKATGSQS